VIGFPGTLEELDTELDLYREYGARGKAGIRVTSVDLILNFDPRRDTWLSWTAPRWMTQGDILFFYHTKNAQPKIRRLLNEARAEEAGTLAGWVNNAAVFRDVSIHSDGTREVLDAISLNIDPAVVGCASAIRRFLAAGTGGAIVNVSSHQAQRAVRGALPYPTCLKPWSSSGASRRSPEG
jgi:NAD(P)-dependent dehydrogenase (short-subunit alcohol dehydrogenase family)